MQKKHKKDNLRIKKHSTKNTTKHINWCKENCEIVGVQQKRKKFVFKLHYINNKSK